KLHTIVIALLSYGNVCGSYGEEPVLEHDGPRPNDCRVTRGVKQLHRQRVVANCEPRGIDCEAEARMHRIGEAIPHSRYVGAVQAINRDTGLLIVYENIYFDDADVVERPPAAAGD